MVKKIALTLAIALCTAFAAMGAEIYTYDESQSLTKGVTLRQIRRFYGDKWLNINCISADLTNPNLKLDLLKGESADSLATLDSLVQTEENVVAAVNGDFFDNTFPKESKGFSLGMEIKDGEMLQSQVNTDMAAAFYDGNALKLGYMNMNITLTAPNGESVEVKHLNKHTSYYGDVLMYTADWNNAMSPAPGGEVVEVVVEDGTITDIRRGLPSVKIPENGCVFAVSEGVSMFFANNTAVGDKLDISISITPSVESIQAAFGGGTLLLKDGEAAEFTHNAAGYNPRTCIGTNQDGSVVYLITVDGRAHLSKGVTQTELADLAKELGCWWAMNLDGGGSTRMTAKTFWDSNLHTINTPTENRKVINAPAIVSTAKESEAVGVKIRLSAKTVLAGDSITAFAKLYDSDMNPLGEASPELSIEGVTVEISDSTLTPTRGGRGVVNAIYNSAVTDSVEITVLDSLAGISVPQSVSLNVGESVALTPEVYSAQGEYAYVTRTELLSPKISDSNVLSYENGTLTGLSEGWATVTLSYGDVKSAVSVKVGNPASGEPKAEASVFKDEMNQSTDAENTFSIFAYSAAPETFFDNFHYIEGLKKISSSTSYGFLGSYDKARLPKGARTPICADSFSAIDKGFALIISLPKSGALSGSDWLATQKAIDQTSAESIIFMTKTAPTGETEADVKVFYDYLEKLSQEKNVFLVQPGERNDSHMRGRLRIITLTDASTLGGVLPSMAYSAYLRFGLDEGRCTYEFVNVFGKKTATD